MGPTRVSRTGPKRGGPDQAAGEGKPGGKDPSRPCGRRVGQVAAGPQAKLRARDRIAAQRAARQRAEARRRLLLAGSAITAVLAVVVALVAVKLTATPARPVASESPASAAVVRQVSSVPDGGLPEHGTYAADDRAGGQRRPTAAGSDRAGDQAHRRLRRTPYVNSADQSGAVPFLDIANRYILAGAQYNPQVLAGLSAAQIASQLSNPSSPVARAIDGSAQVIIAAIDQVLQHEANGA
jgi:hypothetical protein